MKAFTYSWKRQAALLALALGFAPRPALGAAFDVASCQGEAELKAIHYPKSDREAQANCPSGTDSCRKTWGALGDAYQRVKGDYQSLCGATLAPPPADCGTSCLGTAAATTQQTLTHTTATLADVQQVREAALASRKQNLLYVSQHLPKKSAAAADPKCWWDWRASLRMGGMIWAAEARANGCNDLDIAPGNAGGCGRSGVMPGGTNPSNADGANLLSAETAAKANGGAYEGGKESYHDLDRPGHAGPGSSGSNLIGNTPPDSPEAQGLGLARQGKTIPDDLFNRMTSNDVIENLMAADSALQAANELTAREQKLSQDQQALGTQLAQLQTLSNQMASNPDANAGVPAASASPQAADSTPAPGFTPAAGSGGLSGVASNANSGANPIPGPGPDLSPAGPPRTLPQGLAANLAIGAAPPAGADPAAPAAPALNGSLITTAADKPAAAKAGARSLASAAANAAYGDNPYLAQSLKGAALRDRLRQLLAQRGAGPEESPDAEGNLPVHSPAEGALASVLHGSGGTGTGAGAPGEAATPPPPDFTGLTGERYLGRPAESDEMSGTLDRDSPDLFTRVRGAHRRFEKASHLKTAGL